MEEDIKILEELRKKLGLYANGEKIKQGQALENLIKGYREKEESEKYLYDAYQDAGKKMFEYSEKCDELDKDNNELRRLYRRTAIKLKENGRDDLADYFLAQINEIPTFLIEDIDYYAEYHKLKSKIREKIEELEESMNKARPFDLSYIEYCEDRIEVLQELMEDK